MELNNTPRSNRLHIGIFGKVNSGKSTLMNMLTSQPTSIVSSVPGTTTDPVYKAMELAGVGPVVWIDTAGSYDTSQLGEKRIDKTFDVAKKVDIAIVLFRGNDTEEGLFWISHFKEQSTPVITLVNSQFADNSSEELSHIIRELGMDALLVLDISDHQSKGTIIQAIMRSLPNDYEARSLLDGYVEAGDILVFVMPQDPQAPKGRLILPQVQAIRDALEHSCSILCCTTDEFTTCINSLKYPPSLIVCDSQIIEKIAKEKPTLSKLTTFSILFAELKGDLPTFLRGVSAIKTLTPLSKVLIAEACTHAPLTEDIGREKIPRLLRKRIGESLNIEIVAGNDFPDDLKDYDLIIMCGACMFNRQYVLSRVKQATLANIPITNYGIVISYLNNVLDFIEIN